MKLARTEVPTVLEMPEVSIRLIDWDGLTVETGSIGNIAEPLDPAPFFKGLPDDRCQCPHWGFVIKGRLRYSFAGREEVFEAGDVYYAPAGHRPVIEANTEYVEFSNTHELAKTMEVIERNMAAAAGH
jgi:hypothetical protein